MFYLRFQPLPRSLQGRSLVWAMEKCRFAKGRFAERFRQPHLRHLRRLRVRHRHLPHLPRPLPHRLRREWGCDRELRIISTLPNLLNKE